MNLMLLSVFSLGFALLLWASQRGPALTIARGTQPWEHEGVTYKAIEWSNGEVDLFAQFGERMATLRFKSVTDLTLLSQSGDEELANLARAYMLKHKTLQE